MTRKQYLAARRLIRDNGYYALQWLGAKVRAVFIKLRALRAAPDRLAERASYKAWSAKTNEPWSLKISLGFQA